MAASAATSRRLLAIYVLGYLAIAVVHCQQRFGDRPRTLHADYESQLDSRSVWIDRSNILEGDSLGRGKRDVPPATTPSSHADNPNITAKVCFNFLIEDQNYFGARLFLM